MPAKKPATKRPVKKAVVAKKAAPVKKVVAKKPVAKAAAKPAHTARKSNKVVFTLGADEKRLFGLVSVWLALIAVFLAMVVYQLYIQKA